MLLEGKRILITGGTGSLGRVLIRRLLSSELGTPKQIVVFSRDEAKQHYLRLEYQNRKVANFQAIVAFRIGDLRDFASISAALASVDVVFNAAALKQVPSCEYFPQEAVQTNILGAENIVRAIREQRLAIATVVGISTDKACKPVNVMGMTKAIQERILIRANLECPGTRFICVRYGNVLASRGSVIPLFHEQIRNGGPVTITTPEMTRFLLSLNRAVDTIFAALRQAQPGETYIPRVQSARILDLAKALIGDRPIPVQTIGIRPGEKVHEILISEEEIYRAYALDPDHYVIRPMLPELISNAEPQPHLQKEFSSADHVLSWTALNQMLAQFKLRVEDQLDLERDLLC